MLEFILFGVLQGVEKTNWIYIPAVGIFWFLLYYFSFKYLILKFDFKTLGREDDELSETSTTTDDTGIIDLIIRGLGGSDNISELDCCATRLRVAVKHSEKVQENLLKESGCRGVFQNGKGVQIVYGPQVTVIKNKLEEFLNA